MNETERGRDIETALRQRRLTQVGAMKLGPVPVLPLRVLDVPVAEVDSDVLDVGHERDHGARAAAEVEQPLAGPGLDVLAEHAASRAARAEQTLNGGIDPRVGENGPGAARALRHR